MDSGLEAAHSRRDIILGVSITFLILSWVGVMARSYVRLFIMRNYGWDDATILLAVVTYTMYCAFNFLCVSYGFGRPDVLLLGPDNLAKLASYLIGVFALYAATMIILKISLGIFYLRIAIEVWQRVAVYITVGISTIFGTYYFFAAIFQCGNPAHFLENAISGRCNSSEETLYAINLTAGVINAASDIILVALPISLIRKAAMPRPAKISACGILMLGSVGSAVSVVRLAYIKGLGYSGNFFKSGVNITIWSAAEAGICIFAVSLVTLRPMFRCCVENTRRAITPLPSASGGRKRNLGFSTTGDSTTRSNQQGTATPTHAPDFKGPVRPPRPASPMSFQDIGSSRSARSRANSGWTQIPDSKKDEQHVLQEIDSGVARRASMHRGKIRWTDDSALAPPIPSILSPTEPMRQSTMSGDTESSIFPPESPILPPVFKTPSRTTAHRASKIYSMPRLQPPPWQTDPTTSPSAWPKPPAWPKSLPADHQSQPRSQLTVLPRMPSQDPSSRPHVISQYKPAKRRHASTESASIHIPPVVSTYPSGLTFGRGQLGPYESYYGPSAATSRAPSQIPSVPYDLSDYVKPYQPPPKSRPATAHTSSRPLSRLPSEPSSVPEAQKEEDGGEWKLEVPVAPVPVSVSEFPRVEEPKPRSEPETETENVLDGRSALDRKAKRHGFARSNSKTREIGLGIWRLIDE